ncbi:MAG: hypothetical protein KF812_04405 [Fimbriimonadaceae bacterium]|nr:hypothetical protein [Fimbriimonadaceae bacterium]
MSRSTGAQTVYNAFEYACTSIGLSRISRDAFVTSFNGVEIGFRIRYLRIQQSYDVDLMFCDEEIGGLRSEMCIDSALNGLVNLSSDDLTLYRDALNPNTELPDELRRSVIQSTFQKAIIESSALFPDVCALRHCAANYGAGSYGIVNDKYRKHISRTNE